MDSFRFYREQAEGRLTRALDQYLTSAPEDEDEEDDYEEEKRLEEDYLYELGEEDDY